MHAFARLSRRFGSSRWFCILLLLPHMVSGWMLRTEHHDYHQHAVRSSRRTTLNTPSALHAWTSPDSILHVLPGTPPQAPPVSTTLLVSNTNALMFDQDIVLQFATPTVLLLVALILGVLANGWIQRLLSGDRGLGSFLSDGRGYSRSGFAPLTKTNKKEDDRAVQTDPLPWLRLPELDFVEVAGQKERQTEAYERGVTAAATTTIVGRSSSANDSNSDDVIMQQLEGLRLAMNERLQEGKMKEAEALRQQLEALMKESSVRFSED